MGKDVFANNNAISCKAGDGKVIAAFPDVCNSPPSPPAGPIPVPYPDSSFSKDLKDGSSSVKIGGKPVALKNQSYFKTSPLGDEAATRTFGGSLITHTITGKTYFGAWSMDVLFEGMNVCRHLDITTSNHASYPGGTPPFSELETMALARISEGKCPCCNGPAHATGAAKNRDEWYEDRMKSIHDAVKANVQKKLNSATPETKPYKMAMKKLNELEEKFNKKKNRFRDLIQDAKNRPGCTCPDPKPRLLPSPPCDVFFEPPADPAARKAQNEAIERAYNDLRVAQLQLPDDQRQPAFVGAVAGDRALNRSPTKINHLTPRSAGGCPTGDGNLQARTNMCSACQAIDDRFNEFQ